MSDRQRRALLHVLAGGRSVPEVARLLDATPDAIESAVRRARERVRSCLIDARDAVQGAFVFDAAKLFGRFPHYPLAVAVAGLVALAGILA